MVFRLKVTFSIYTTISKTPLNILRKKINCTRRVGKISSPSEEVYTAVSNTVLLPRERERESEKTSPTP